MIDMKLLKTGVWTLVFLLVGLTGCQDDFIEGGYTNTKADISRAMETPGPLQRNSDGLWVADNQRVPLVGVGRIVNRLNPGLVAINKQADFECVTDLNLDNGASLDGVMVSAGGPILSVKDMYRTYAGGQRVGFVISSGKEGELLEANVLNLMTVTTHLDGGDSHTYNLSEEGALLNVNLLSTSTQSVQVLSVEVDYPFDEIELSTMGISATINWAGMEIDYAFVGETPKTPVNSVTYPDATFEEHKGMNNPAEMLTPEFSGNIFFNNNLIIVDIGGTHSCLLDFGEEIPAYTEVGYTYNQGEVGKVGLYTEITVTPYSNDTPLEEEAYNKKILLDLGVAAGGTGDYSVVPSKAIRKLEFKSFTAIGVNVGAMALKGVYTRKPTVIDPTSYFTAPEEVTTTSSSYYFMAPLIDEKGKLTDDLKKSILKAQTLTELEDIYAPYKSKKKTKADIAREAGVEPVAEYIKSNTNIANLEDFAKDYTNENTKDIDTVLSMARDIITEDIGHNINIKNRLREIYNKTAVISTIQAEDFEERTPYEAYYEFEEKVSTLPPHRILAIFRGERENILKVKLIIQVNRER